MTIPASNPAAGVLIAILMVGVILMWFILRLRRARPDMRIGRQITAAFAVRLLAIIAVNATGLGASLRGGDEITFLTWAQDIATHPLGSAYLPHGVYQLQTDLFALQIKLGFMNESAIRVTQIGIALLGFVFMLAAVYDLGGPRAASFAALCLILEPSSIFFNTEIHKESLLELAAGLAAFGGVWMWKRLDLRGIFIMALGCLIAIETRSYAGWFLACGCVLIIMHASLRNTQRKGTAVALVYAVIVAVMIAAPTLLAATSGSNLKRLQASQSQNSSGVGQGGHANLALESVDISSRSAVITSLPTKIEELILEPWPWQLHDSSEMFGAVGSLIAYLVLGSFIRYAWINRGDVFGRAGPLLYPLLIEMVAYAVTVGNAGTGFRYRSHLVSLGICSVAVLRETARRRQAESAALVEPAAMQDSAHSPLHSVTA